MLDLEPIGGNGVVVDGWFERILTVAMFVVRFVCLSRVLLTVLNGEIRWSGENGVII